MGKRPVRSFAPLLAITVLLGTPPAFAKELPPDGSATDDDVNVHDATIEGVASEGHHQGL